MICLRGGELAGWGVGEGRGRPRAGRLLPIRLGGGVDADWAGSWVSRRAAQTRRRLGASNTQLAARAGGQELLGQGWTPGAGHAPLERALRPTSGPRAVRLQEEGGWPFKSRVPVRGEGVPKVGQGRRWGSGAGKLGGFLCAPLNTSPPTILHRVARGQSGVANSPPHPTQREEMVSVRGD